MAALCEAFDWRLDLRDMAYYSHWLTPVVRPKRFDTRFFVRLAPPEQQAMPDFGEALELMWLTSDEALQPQRALKLLNVTQRTLHDMRGFASARAAYEHALALRGVALHFPRPALGPDGQRFIIEDHPAYEEVEYLDPDGRGDVRCELSPGDVTQLSPRLWRVAGAARHAFVVCDSAHSQAVLIDADVADAAQQAALQSLAMPVCHGPIDTRRGAAAPDRLQLGADCTLRLLDGGANGLAFVIEQDGIAIADSAWTPATAPGAGWLALTRGFMRRMR
jgi:hypothetical protein